MDVLAVVEGGVVLGGDDKVGIVGWGVLLEGTFGRGKVAVVAKCFVGVGEAVDGNNLSGVGEE